jgi:NDP-sugar pyrophosphorylase family protein
VIVSSNSGIVIKLFLDRDDIQKRFRDNKIIIRAVVANKMGFDKKGNVNGLSHRQNIIDINTKKDYIPLNNTVLVDKRDSHLKDSHNHVIFVRQGETRHGLTSGQKPTSTTR